ncbi:uncharacterized protein L201_006895 [Kwoniella dendrophila CBS 6074]|uniref:Uncharacterized protein n=1 Tax=Kwoniella dendrophila CBS 6074 TaxID=1295534 RepID=A0AAX4K442_9TREE
MAFSSLADELAGAFDNDEPLDVNQNLGNSLADEFGLNYERELGLNLDNGNLGAEMQEPSTPLLNNKHNTLPRLKTPLRYTDDNNRPDYSPTNLDEISPNRGIDLDLELELQLNDGHSYSPINHNGQQTFQTLGDEFGFNNEFENDTFNANRLSLGSSPIKSGNIRNKSSNRSLKFQKSNSSIRGLFNKTNSIVNHEELSKNHLIILSESLASTSRLLSSLKQLNSNSNNSHGYCHHEGKSERHDVKGTNSPSLEDKLQEHLNKMNDVERKRDEWIRDLGFLSREAGLGGLDGDLTIHDQHLHTIDLNNILEEEDDEDRDEIVWQGGWTGELDLLRLEEETPGYRPDEQKGKEQSDPHPLKRETHTKAAEENTDSHHVSLNDDSEDIDGDDDLSHDSFYEDFGPKPFNVPSFSYRSPTKSVYSDHDELSHSSSTSPLTNHNLNLNHNHKYNHDANQHVSSTSTTMISLPNLIKLLKRDTDSLLETLKILSDNLHNSNSYQNSIARQMKGIKVFVEDLNEKNKIENDARNKLDLWEQYRLKIGLTRNKTKQHNNNNDINEDGKEGKEHDDKCLSIKDKLDNECNEFQKLLDKYTKKVDEIRRNTAMIR